MKTKLLFYFVILTSIFWRFYNFSNRWTLNQDQARDAIIALWALNQKTLPLLGPPSSAGPFSFGPIYYWIIELFTLIPISPFGPWLGFSFLSVLSVIVLYFFGKNLLDKRFAFILGITASFASLDIFNAPDLLNPMLIGLAVSVVFFSLQKIVDQRKLFFSVILGIFVGLAINFHLQALGLIPIILLIIIFAENFLVRVKILLGSFIGLFLAFTPLIYFDILHQGAWIKSIIHYVAVGQNKFNLPSSWTFDFKDFWPSIWGQIITNQSASGYLLIFLFISSLLLGFKNKLRISKSIKIIFLSLLFQIIMLHFYKGPRMSVYLIVFHPFFIFLTAYSIWVIGKFYKYLGWGLLLLILIIAAYSNWQIVNLGSQISQILEIKHSLEKNTYPPFRIYSYESSFNISLPLYYLLLKEGKISSDGIKVGACDYFINRAPNLYDYIENCPTNNNLILKNKQYRLFNLEKDYSTADKLFEVRSDKIYNWLYDNYSE